jgi:hypothetical protein
MAGVPEAISGISRAYADGEIRTSVGTVKVKKDLAKAAGAAMAMLEFAPEEEKSELWKNIETLVAVMSDAERARMTNVRKSYVNAYRLQSTNQNADPKAAIETPDSACAPILKSMDRAGARVE